MLQSIGRANQEALSDVSQAIGRSFSYSGDFMAIFGMVMQQIASKQVEAYVEAEQCLDRITGASVGLLMHRVSSKHSASIEQLQSVPSNVPNHDSSEIKFPQSHGHADEANMNLSDQDHHNQHNQQIQGLEVWNFKETTEQEQHISKQNNQKELSIKAATPENAEKNQSRIAPAANKRRSVYSRTNKVPRVEANSPAINPESKDQQVIRKQELISGRRKITTYQVRDSQDANNLMNMINASEQQVFAEIKARTEKISRKQPHQELQEIERDSGQNPGKIYKIKKEATKRKSLQRQAETEQQFMANLQFVKSIRGNSISTPKKQWKQEPLLKKSALQMMKDGRKVHLKQVGFGASSQNLKSLEKLNSSGVSVLAGSSRVEMLPDIKSRSRLNHIVKPPSFSVYTVQKNNQIFVNKLAI